MSHRYLDRIANLGRRLNSLLENNGAQVEFTLWGVEHAGHVFPDAVPALRDVDLVFMELPTTPVKAYLDPGGGGDGICVRNLFWLDLLEHFRRSPPRFGVHGCNVNPHVRYLSTRLYYSGGKLVNDFEAPPVVVRVPGGARHSLTDLGGSGLTEFSAHEVVSALREPDRETFGRNGILHVSADENPFGPSRHLIVCREPPESLLALQEAAVESIAGTADRYHLSEADRLSFARLQLLEGFLLPVNDFYLVETLLRTLIRAVERANGPVRAVHVAGLAHVPHLRAYFAWADCPRLRIEVAKERRLPVTPYGSLPAFFAEELQATLDCVSLHREELQVKIPECRRLLARFAREHSGELARRILLKAIWSWDRPPEQEEWSTLAEEIPLQPSRAAWEQYASRLNRTILEWITGQMLLPDLEQLNARLARQHRRGSLAAIGQELQHAGWTFASMLDHPSTGRYTRALESLWDSTACPDTWAQQMREMLADDARIV